MLYYKEDFEKTRERLFAFWEREVIDRCAMAVIAPKKTWAPPVIPKEQKALEDYYLNPETIYKRACYEFENKFYGGDALPTVMPFLGTAGHAAYFDITYRFADDTIWFFPIMEDITDPLTFRPENDLYVRQKDMMRKLTKLANGKFLISMPDNCGSLDALCQLRGSEELLMDLYEDEDAVFAQLDKIMDALFFTNEEFFEIIRENNCGGSVHQWMHTFHPGRHMQLQADLSCMISPDMYEKFVLPELIRSSEKLDAAIYHLDGMEQVRHLDMILSVPGISAIQWTPVAGQPKTSEFIKVFQKIQAAGKCLVLVPHYSEVELILEHLSPKGLMLCVQGVPDEETAALVLKKACLHAC